MLKRPLSIYLRRFYLFIRKIISKLLVLLRIKKSKNARKKGNYFNKRINICLNEFTSVLDSLEVRKGDIIIIHSGTSNLGKLEGGVKNFLLKLREKVSDSGTLLFPTFPFKSYMYEFVKSKPVFNVKDTPSKMGTLSQIALSVDEGVRSLHPTHPVFAIGAHAKDLTSQHHLGRTPFNRQSPFWKLSESGGKILMLGVGLNSVTNFHVVEDKLGEMFPVNTYLNRAYHLKCIDKDGREIFVETKCHDPFISRIRDCNIVRKRFFDEGIMRTATVGKGPVSILDANKMDKCLEELCLKNRITIYGKIWGIV